MAMRIIGGLVILCGVAALVVGVMALWMQNPLAQSVSLVEHRAQEWMMHWRWWGIGDLLLGTVIVISGCLIFLRKQWGLLLLATAAIALAAAPWVLDGLGLLRFQYEQPILWESALFSAVGAAALVTWLRAGRAHVET